MLNGALSAPENIDNASIIDLLCFDVGNERFAVELWSVDEVVDAAVLDAYDSDGSVAGVMRLRNELLPVYDAASVLRVQRVSITPMALIFSLGDSAIAVLVDNAEAALAVGLDGLRSPGAIISEDDILTGALKVGQRWVGLLHAAAMIEALVRMPLAQKSHAS